METGPDVAVDGVVRWRCADLKKVVSETMTILTLPLYSPELNPAENIWQYLRQNTLANRLYASDEAIVEACCDAWNSFAEAPDVVRSITDRDCAKMS